MLHLARRLGLLHRRQRLVDDLLEGPRELNVVALDQVDAVNPEAVQTLVDAGTDPCAAEVGPGAVPTHLRGEDVVVAVDTREALA